MRQDDANFQDDFCISSKIIEDLIVMATLKIQNKKNLKATIWSLGNSSQL